MPVPGEVLVKDKDDILTYVFDWSNWLDGTITTSTFTLEPADGVLTKDNEAIVTGSLKTTLRLTGGKAGREYRVINKIVTNETPAQTKQEFFILRVLDN